MEHGQKLRLDEEAVLQVDVLIWDLVRDLQLAVQLASRAFSRHFEPLNLLEVVVDLEKEGMQLLAHPQSASSVSRSLTQENKREYKGRTPRFKLRLHPHQFEQQSSSSK